MEDVWKVLAGVLTGGSTGAVIAHCFTVRREISAAKSAAISRLRRYRGFIMKCRCILYRSTDLTKDYTAIAPELAFEYGLVAADCSGNERLVALCEKADRWREADYNKDRNTETWENPLTKHMDDIRDALDSHIKASCK